LPFDFKDLSADGPGDEGRGHTVGSCLPRRGSPHGQSLSPRP
jgi:hypothetical protein